MTSSSVYDSITLKRQSGKKQLCILLDPDELRLDNIDFILNLAQDAVVDYFFVGGSIVVNNKLDDCLTTLKLHSEIPVVLFPGNVHQISPIADAILYLSLISGRNPELFDWSTCHKCSNNSSKWVGSHSNWLYAGRRGACYLCSIYQWNSTDSSRQNRNCNMYCYGRRNARAQINLYGRRQWCNPTHF